MLRLVPTLAADGPSHMALDEALLEAADQPTLRLYRWVPATVSLGYFQDHADIAARLPAGMPLVRRITGGGAIWHDDEVTYALVGRLGEAGFPLRIRDMYCQLHGAILAALAQRGAALALQPETVGDRRYRFEPRCFASPAADDLVHPTGGKVLGSAGRERAGRVLVHGSLKLASNVWDQDAVTGCGLDWNAAAEALRAGIATALGQTLHDGALTDQEQETAVRIRNQRYGTDQWVRLRIGPKA